MDKTAKFMEAVQKEYGNINQITREQVKAITEKYDLPWPSWLVADASNRVSRGVYKLNIKGDNVSENVELDDEIVLEDDSNIWPMKSSTGEEMLTYVPSLVSGYVPFGNYKDLTLIVKSERFYPVYVTGLSGNGKTMMVEQICAKQKREMIRANITIETDEDDLIGGFRLVRGETEWQDGPVITAMKRGAILLLDEVDLGSHKLMCLQPVLEGKPIYVKKINQVIVPAHGFNIIATANTKGKGSDDGRFIGTNVMNEAFLERFSVTMEQEYPAKTVEVKILNNVLGTFNIKDEKFTDLLVNWSTAVRKAFYEQAVNEVITTRRLVHICEAFAIFGQNRKKSIELCLARFDDETKKSFMDFYEKIDDTINPSKEKKEAVDTNVPKMTDAQLATLEQLKKTLGVTP